MICILQVRYNVYNVLYLNDSTSNPSVKVNTKNRLPSYSTKVFISVEFRTSTQLALSMTFTLPMGALAYFFIHDNCH